MRALVMFVAGPALAVLVATAVMSSVAPPTATTFVDEATGRESAVPYDWGFSDQTHEDARLAWTVARRLGNVAVDTCKGYVYSIFEGLTTVAK